MDDDENVLTALLPISSTALIKTISFLKCVNFTLEIAIIKVLFTR